MYHYLTNEGTHYVLEVVEMNISNHLNLDKKQDPVSSKNKISNNWVNFPIKVAQINQHYLRF